MKKLLLLLLGLLLIFILTYVCFQSKSFGIKDDLLRKSETVFLGKNMPRVNIEIKGDGLKQTRVLSLVGTVSTEKQKEEAQSIAENIEGIDAVDNQLIVILEPAIVKIKTPKVLTTQPIVESSHSELPYNISGIKGKDGKVTLRGYVANLAIHNNLIAYGKVIFGATNIVDELKELEGTSKDWYESAKIGLEKLDFVEYGQYRIKNKNFSFEGYVPSREEKESLLLSFKNSLDSNYNVTYNISTPNVEVKEVGNICQLQFKEVLSKNKIHFSYNKSAIKKESYGLLKNLLRIAKKCPNEIIIVGGHTDSNGEEKYNQKLSSRRANSVKRYFVRKGIDTNKIEAIGYGELHPITTNSTKIGRKQNRRIEVKIKGVE